MEEGVHPDYSWVTDEMFAKELVELLKDRIYSMPRAEAIHHLLRIEGIYEILSEEFNNEILDRLTEQWMTDKVNTEVSPAID